MHDFAHALVVEWPIIEQAQSFIVLALGIILKCGAISSRCDDAHECDTA
jgi:hypothetical protein